MRLRNVTKMIAVCVLAGGTLSGCGKEDVPVVTTSAYVFGTLVDITIRGTDPKTAEAAVAELSDGFQQMHDDWHAWKPLGELYKVNQSCQTGEAVTVSDKTVAAIGKAKEFYVSSHTLFNAAIGRVIGLWGFHSDELPKGYRPPFEEIKALIDQKPSMDDIHVNGHTVTCTNPAVGLDFGGFGKGMALDWALAELKKKGIKNAVVNAGGDVSTMGHYVDGKSGRPWRVGIRHPKTWGVLASLNVEKDEAVYTSGNYERYHDHDGIRYSHIIDPRDGRAMHEIVSTTVIHTNGALADAAATGLTVAGPKNWPAIAASMGVKQVLLVDEQGVMYASPEMAKRLIFEDGKKPDIQIMPIPE